MFFQRGDLFFTAGVFLRLLGLYGAYRGFLHTNFGRNGFRRRVISREYYFYGGTFPRRLIGGHITSFVVGVSHYSFQEDFSKATRTTVCVIFSYEDGVQQIFYNPVRSHRYSRSHLLPSVRWVLKSFKSGSKLVRVIDETMRRSTFDLHGVGFFFDPYCSCMYGPTFFFGFDFVVRALCPKRCSLFGSKRGCRQGLGPLYQVGHRGGSNILAHIVVIGVNGWDCFFRVVIRNYVFVVFFMSSGI